MLTTYYPLRRQLVALAAVLALAACASSTQVAPQPGDSRGGVPDLEGQKVMVFPVQRSRGLDPALDASSEVAYALGARGGADWIMPAELHRAIERTPGLALKADGLPVDMFLRAQVDRVGDPLYGHLRRLAAITAADLALLPVQARGGEPDAVGKSQVSIAATLINARTGRVYWFGIVEGSSGSGAAGALASASEALARAVTPLMGRDADPVLEDMS